jgi:hypothetical protein
MSDNIIYIHKNLGSISVCIYACLVLTILPCILASVTGGKTQAIL